MTGRNFRTFGTDADQLNKAAVFAAVVREGSFSKGAEALGLARSTASEHVASLEAALGVRLLERTTRRIRLTEEGELLYEHVDAALRTWGQARAAVQERRAEPVGTLRITAPAGLASAIIAPIVGALLREHDRLSAQLIVDDRLRDIVADRIDVAIRMAPLEDSTLFCRKLGATRTILVAAPGVAPDDPEPPDAQAVETLPWISHSNIPAPTCNLYDASGKLQVVRPHYRAEGSNSEGQVSLIESGCGVALMPRMLVEAALDAGRMVHVYPRWHGREIPVYAVYPKATFTPARVTRFVDRLAEAFDR